MFDPDAYLGGSSSFDPDSYLETAATPKKKGLETFTGKTLSALKEFTPFPTSVSEATIPMSGRRQDLITSPLKPLIGIEKYAGETQERASDIMSNIPSNANVGGAVKFGMGLLPFSPSAIGGTMGLTSDIVGAASKFPNKAIAPKTGKAYMENLIPSKPEEIRHSTRYLDKDAADLVLERPHLGNSREEILKNARQGAEVDLENQIQAKMQEAVKNGKLPPQPKIPTAGTMPTIQLPGGGKVPRIGEPKVGTIPRWLEPGEQGLQTSFGKGFTKKKGVFDPGEPDIVAKQTDYIKQDVANRVAKIRSEFEARAASPEYAGLKKEYAVGKQEIADSVDKVIDNMKTGTEVEAIEGLKKLKQEFIDSHPNYADVQYWTEIKRAIYKLIGDKGYLSQALSSKVKALKAFANEIKKRTEKIVPGIKELNSEQGALMEIRDAIIQSSPKEVRDVSLTRPFKERMSMFTSRALSEKRSPKGVGMSVLPLITINENR